MVDTPRLVLGSSDKGEMKTLTFFNDSQQQFTSLELNKKQETSFLALIDLFANKKTEDGSIDNLIADSLRLYAQAMDSIFDYNCFLSLWQIAERMCCSSFFQGSTKEIVNRLKSHSHRFNLIGSGYIHVLGKLADKRNALVHRGIHHKIEDEDINILKVICEIVLKWIIDERKNLKTEMQLNEFYKFYKLRNEDRQKLVAMKDAILFVEKNR